MPVNATLPPLANPVIRRNVPVWAEHTAPIGKGTRFTKAELEGVAAKGNERIDDVGRFAPIILNHSDESGEAKPVVGYMGRFSVQRIGRLKPRWAIVTDLHYSREFEPKIKDYPGHSVEYVFRDDAKPTEGVLDALALLPVGKSPALELGLLYSAEERRLRYSAESIEAMTQEETMNPEELQPLIEALKPVIAEMIAAALSGANPAPPPGGSPATSPPPGGALPYESNLTQRVNYEQLVTRERETREKLAQVEQRLAASEADKKKAVRYEAFSRLKSDGYIVADDLGAEVAKLEKFDDEQFAVAIEQRRQYGLKVPGGSLPIPPSEQRKVDKDGNADLEKRAKYSAAAQKLVVEADNQGKRLSYAEALAQVQQAG
jgi:hypothetical protein